MAYSYLDGEDRYEESSSATSSESSIYTGMDHALTEYTAIRSQSPAESESEYSLSMSFSSVATSDFCKFLADIGFIPSTLPSEMVPPCFLYAVIRGNPADVFEEPREETIEVERLPRSYVDWVEYSIPLSRFLFTEYWISWKFMRSWDGEDESQMKGFEESQHCDLGAKNKSKPQVIKQERSGRSSHNGMIIWHKSSPTPLPSVRFSPLDDDRGSTWSFRSDRNSSMGFKNDRFGASGDSDYKWTHELESSSSSKLSSILDPGENKSTLVNGSAAVLAQKYRRRYGGTWKVVEMVAGILPQYVEEMQDNLMRGIL